eukprot:CAMPEP_0206317960 /NCGR_PEP_ID=MMETSP0106_2-20121207/16916_1 /ASSEMBLY_ACC=CAM_ASM_000206 /TAXON_ID=81532 /ORGANISM="Acanthoeca-like sp., Strain 10tr" /LENGTH=60 /DNA_ID=CAMNT_0053749591 /DNA_START=56 /DNA_END=238 /DNA_ORIENTATION=-
MSNRAGADTAESCFDAAPAAASPSPFEPFRARVARRISRPNRRFSLSSLTADTPRVQLAT